MNRILRDSLNITYILSRIYRTNDGIFVDSSTNMNDERVFPVVCVWGGRGGGGIYSKEAIEILK